MKHESSAVCLLQENDCFSNPAGSIDNHPLLGFQPAFRDNTTGDVYLSRFADGRCAPVHVLAGLPDELVTQRTATGEISAIRDCVASGFVRAGYFFTRDEAAKAAATRH